MRERAGSKDDALRSHCRGCGENLGSLDRIYCDACLERQRIDAASQGRKTLDAKRATGRDQRSTVEVRAKRREDAAHQMREIAQWEALNGPTHSAKQYKTEIAPRLCDVPVRVLTEATGLSVIYCRQIRLGKRVPHPRHWEALGNVAREHGQSIPVHWDTAFYLREIAPKLAPMTPRAIAKATGLSVPYCKRLRRAKQLPRRHHWPALFKLASS